MRDIAGVMRTGLAGWSRLYSSRRRLIAFASALMSKRITAATLHLLLSIYDMYIPIDIRTDNLYGPSISFSSSAAKILDRR